ncbi:MAG: hypothetical protein ACXVQU_10550 [Actinomycetota bacterium]
MNDSRIRYVIALGDDADIVQKTDGTAVVERLDNVVLVEADVALAKELARAGEYVHVFTSPHDALRVLALFRTAS